MLTLVSFLVSSVNLTLLSMSLSVQTPRFRLVCLVLVVCTCISQSLIYRVGDGDSSLIFNLLCNHPEGATCEIPRTLPRPLQLVGQGYSLRVFLEVLCASLSTRLSVVKSSLRSALRLRS